MTVGSLLRASHLFSKEPEIEITTSLAARRGESWPHFLAEVSEGAQETVGLASLGITFSCTHLSKRKSVKKLISLG